MCCITFYTHYRTGPKLKVAEEVHKYLPFCIRYFNKKSLVFST